MESLKMAVNAVRGKQSKFSQPGNAADAHAAEQQRRSSSRSIKRKRFDDEIVEYSIGVPSQSREPHRVGRPRAQPQINNTVATSITAVNVAQPPPPPPLPPPPPPPPTTTTTQPSAPLPLSLPLPLPTPLTTPLPASLPLPVTLPQPQQIPQRNNHVVGKIVTPATINTPAAPSTPQVLPVHPLNMPPKPILPLPSLGKTEKKRPVRTAKRTRRTGRPPNQIATKDLGRWKPMDDLSLIIGVQQTNDLRIVHRGTKFSCKFTLQELQARWYSLLYEPPISRIAVAAMRNMHPESIEAVQRKALFSIQEEELLGTFKSLENPSLEQFQCLLDKNASLFFSSRTAKILQKHWQLLKQYQLLPDQSVKPMYNTDQPLTFSDAEDLVMDSELTDNLDVALEMELALTDRRKKHEIRLLENELSRWNVLVDSITGSGLIPEFDSQTLAVLRGRLVRYLMRSKEITIGRDAKDWSVDIDFSLEGPASKISRKQGTIKLRSNGDFFIMNEGKRPLFINGMPLLTCSKTRLSHNCVVEIAGLRFVFLVNYDLINAIRYESAKTTSPLK